MAGFPPPNGDPRWSAFLHAIGALAAGALIILAIELSRFPWSELAR